ncbi:MAG: hypothetical protein ABR604_09400, partial [Jatrophihabitantaceae bacterium]
HGTPPLCQASLTAVELHVRLSARLRTRGLIDAKDGGAHPLLDPTTVLKPGYLPNGYAAGQPRWGNQAPAPRRRLGIGFGRSATIPT